MDEDLMAGYEGTPTATPAPDADAKPEDVIETKPEPKFVQLTEEEVADLKARAAQIDEIKATHTKGLDTAFGKIGGIERMLQEFQKGGIGEISEDDFQEIKDEYPELLGSLVKGMNRALAKAKPQDTEALQKTIASTAMEIAQHEVAKDRLFDAVPDWQEVVKTPEFNEFASKLDVKDQEKLGGWDARFIAGKIKEFKSKVEPKAEPKPDARKDRFNAAVNPRGSGAVASSPSDLDSFHAGYNSG